MNYTSIKSGDWNDPTTWGAASYPSVDGDAVTIAVGHEVVYNVNASAVNLGAINIYGIFRCSRTMTTYLKMGYGDSSINVFAGGSFYWGNSEVEPIPSAYKATICFTFNRSDRGFVVNAQGLFQMHGDPLYQPVRIATMAEDWTTGATFKVQGDVSATWRIGDYLSVVKYTYPSTITPRNADQAVVTIKSMSFDGTNTSIETNEGYSITCLAGAPVMHLDCNNVVVTSVYDTYDRITETGKWFFTRSGGVVANYFSSPTTLYCVTLAAGQYVRVEYNLMATKCLFRNFNYPSYSGSGGSKFEECLFWTTNYLTYACKSHQFKNCYMLGTSNMRDMYGDVLVENCWIWNGMDGPEAAYININCDVLWKNCRFFCNAVYTATLTRPNNLYQDCYFYYCRSGFYGNYNTKFERCYFGYQPNGTSGHFCGSAGLDFDIYVQSGGPRFLMKNCKMFWAGGNDYPRGDGRETLPEFTYYIYSENDGQIEGANKMWSNHGRWVRDAAVHNLASCSLAVSPLVNCGYTGPMLTVTPPQVLIAEWTEQNVPASIQSRRVYVRGTGWTIMPTASQLYLEAEYYDAAGAWTQTTIASANVLSGNGVWEPLTVSFTPGRIGDVVYRVVLAKYEAGAMVYLDHALYYNATEFLEATFDWGKSILPAAAPQKALAVGDVRDGVSFGSVLAPGTGVLDLPAETDVRDGTQYDNATKEGNVELPAEAEVLLGKQYGANGTEFTGTLQLLELTMEFSSDDVDGVTLELDEINEITMEVD